MLRFSLRQLEYFVAAAQHGSTARAAEALAVSWNTANDSILAEGRRVLNILCTSSSTRSATQR